MRPGGRAGLCEPKTPTLTPGRPRAPDCSGRPVLGSPLCLGPCPGDLHRELLTSCLMSSDSSSLAPLEPRGGSGRGARPPGIARPQPCSFQISLASRTPKDQGLGHVLEQVYSVLKQAG